MVGFVLLWWHPTFPHHLLHLLLLHLLFPLLPPLRPNFSAVLVYSSTVMVSGSERTVLSERIISLFHSEDIFVACSKQHTNWNPKLTNFFIFFLWNFYFIFSLETSETCLKFFHQNRNKKYFSSTKFSFGKGNLFFAFSINNFFRKCWINIFFSGNLFLFQSKYFSKK